MLHLILIYGDVKDYTSVRIDRRYPILLDGGNVVAMTIIEFPPIETASKDGVLAFGGDLEVESLLLAYSNGIFPWPSSDTELVWFAPPKRAILFLKDFHVSRSLKRTLNSGTYRCTVDQDFRGVIEGCAKAKNRKGQKGTWITPGMIEAYCNLHEAGFAHSVECYLGERLVGGVYGVSIGAMFAAESMFHSETDASKVALHHLIKILEEKKVLWLDAQVINPFLSKLGFKDVTRARFMNMLACALKCEALFSAARQ